MDLRKMHNGKTIIVYLAKLENSGGIESHIFEFLEAFKSTDVKINIVVSNMLMESYNIDRIKMLSNEVLYTAWNNKWLRYFWLLKVCILLSLKKVDALYTNGQGGSFWLLSKFIRYKKWVHHHHTSGDKADQATWGKYYKKVMRHADDIIACSSRNAYDIQDVIFRPVISIPCFSRKVIPNKNSRDKAIINFGYYGRLIPEKGIDTIIALSQDEELDNIRFHIWGSGWAYTSKSFDNLDRLSYHGTFNSQQELNKIISQIDGFLLISKHPEGLPISLLEVMSAGLPWLATNRGGIPDIACDIYSTRVLSPSPTYNEVKSAILEFANDIREGKIDNEKQMDLYNSKFSTSALLCQWTKVLQL